MRLNFVAALVLSAIAIWKGIAALIAAWELAPWTFYVFVSGLAIVCYLLNAVLMASFIQTRAPEFLSSEEPIPGLQKWELTAGLGIVPKWVSWIGMLSISCVIALLLQIGASLVAT